MRRCCLCNKKKEKGSFFSVPTDERRRNKWSEICKMTFPTTSYICMDHFAPNDIVKGRRNFLMPSAVPSIPFNLNNIADQKTQNCKFMCNLGTLNKMVMPPQLREEILIELPVQLKGESITEVASAKSFSCAASTQTNTRLCGLVEALELSDEFCINCFYCSNIFPLERWKEFTDHLREEHFEIEEEFKNNKFVLEGNDYSSIDFSPSSSPEPVFETNATNSKPNLPVLMDPLESTNLSCSYEQLDGKDECEVDSIEIIQQKPTEIVFEYTPSDIVNLLLDSMKNYPVLWQFDEEPFNEDFYEAVEDLCKIINDKWSLNVTNLKMRRSINRILRFYCYLYPNDNIENIDQFTCYYDKCATFLPSVTEIAYARCSHCYICYKCDFDLKNHLLEEYRNLQWPYKCIRCKECFIDSDEYDFHRCLPHYDEIFRCAICNKRFNRRNVYNKHVSEKHPKEAKYKCDICEKVFKNRNNLRSHKFIHGEKNQKCHLCPKSFAVKDRLRLHLKLHRRQYDYMCELCGQKLFNKATLRIHMKKHTKEKITCSICHLKLRKSSLSRHLRLLHVAYEGTIEQTLKGRHVNYKRIRRIKYSGRSCDCEICDMSFENYDLVVEHNKEFHPEIPKWPCKICAMDFSLKKHLKRHCRRKHKLDLIQVNKLVEENEDLNVVLSYDEEYLDKASKVYGSGSKQINSTKSNIKSSLRANLLPDDNYFMEEKSNSYEIQDEEIIDADYIEEQDDLFAEYIEEDFSNL